MMRFGYAKGLRDLGNGFYAYLRPDGGWERGNSGLIADQGRTPPVDTLMNRPPPRDRLAAT
jgi:hypothetical protein